jgi:UDP-glucose 4-epimerase
LGWNGNTTVISEITRGRRFFIVGGAGFIGSHIIDYLLKSNNTLAVTVFDNFSSGRSWHFKDHLSDERLKVITGDVKDITALRRGMEGHEVVVHLASNPDIARAIIEPEIDFREGTLLTQNVLEAMRTSSAKRILYASGSGVYGDIGDIEPKEDYGPLIPISTYAASKLAGEALISAYCHMFDLSACVFRFANVVGPRQTHGVGYDFIRKLLKDPTRLTILGDGTQSKSYIHVTDVVNAIFTANEKTVKHYEAYNVATGDYVTVKEIADLAVECLGLANARYEFTGGRGGWKGDVPVVRFNTERIRKLGWAPKMNSREALRDSMLSMISDMKKGQSGKL